MALDLLTRTIDFLREKEGEKFTAREIAKALMVGFPELCQKKKERSSRLKTDGELLQQIAAEIGAGRPQIQKKCPQIEISEGRPRRYFYHAIVKASANFVNCSQNYPAEKTDVCQQIREHDLYPILTSYLKSEHNAWGKRIDEKRASNQQGAGANRWLFPDIVAFEDFSCEWGSRGQRLCTALCSVAMQTLVF
ncbi:MAG: hypothetical protein WB791_02110 [Waddliaceae bacterium]